MHKLKARPRIALLAITLSLVIFACTSRGGEESGKVELTVFAASSLTEALEELEHGFEQSHPEVDVQLTFAGSQVLRLQIEQGASVDLFASANGSHMRALVDAGDVSRSRFFARNELVVIVPLSNPAKIKSFDGLAEAQRIVVGTDNVPVGIYTRKMLERARKQVGEDFVTAVRSHIVSEESNVRLVRAKIELGEADAAVVYQTDAASSERVAVVPIPEALNVRASYTIGALTRSSHPAEASQFIDYLLSPEGGRALSSHGFVAEVK